MPTLVDRRRTSGRDRASFSIEDAVKSPRQTATSSTGNRLRGERRFPARADLTLRGMAAILPFCVILSVIDDGADFEFDLWGMLSGKRSEFTSKACA